jgi:hypothetical protein
MRATARAIAPRDAEIDALRAEMAALAARVAALEASRPRDAEDAALRQLLPESTRSLLFLAIELQRHASTDERLAAALQAACLQSPGEIGAWLRGQRGTRDGVTISRHGKRWRATWAT